MSENDAPELKPCPWCKAVPEVLSGAGYNFTVECLNETCPVSPATVGIRGRANAIKTWNTRADLTAPDAPAWSKEFPKIDGIYWMRFFDPASEAMIVELKRGVLTETGVAGDVRYRVSTEMCEFLGPITPATPDAVRQARREQPDSTRQRGLVVMSALINFIDWLDREQYLDSKQERGEIVKEFLDAHKDGQNYFMQAEQIADALGIPFKAEEREGRKR